MKKGRYHRGNCITQQNNLTVMIKIFRIRGRDDCANALLRNGVMSDEEAGSKWIGLCIVIQLVNDGV